MLPTHLGHLNLTCFLSLAVGRVLSWARGVFLSTGALRPAAVQAVGPLAYFWTLMGALGGVFWGSRGVQMHHSMIQQALDPLKLRRHYRRHYRRFRRGFHRRFRRRGD
jgi:hypothetical protein